MGEFLINAGGPIPMIGFQIVSLIMFFAG
ncbi:MAG TPA: NADH-quinone oxidoreductase subunit K, partial [Porphyromonadaceae bacterium]|nr:NADH-quinone oxidoreductase subunit K [Porphyromonadaceae bacterium]